MSPKFARRAIRDVVPSSVASSLLGRVVCLLAWGAVAFAQTADLTDADSADEHVAQLQTCREGILDPQSRPDERRRWVELLLSYETPQANGLIAEFLSTAVRTDVLVAVSNGIAERGRRNPQRLDEPLVEPLLNLLGSDSEELRSAAARALAEFPGHDVPERLRTLAARSETPRVTRLAAIDALAPNTHRREVVARLIALLELQVPEITDRVAAALEPIAPRSFGCDVAQWRTWWEGQSQLEEQVWLAQQLRLYRDRARRLSSELQSQKADAEREAAAVTSRIREFQRELFRPLPPEQRDAKLVEWIEDPLPAVKLAALAIVKGRISDEGKRPEGDVLASLLRLLKHDSPAMRRESLLILRNLSDPAVVEAVLARLNDEKDMTVRHALFQSLGKLGSPAAVPTLVREVASPGSSADCVREAALALGMIAEKPEAAEAVRGAAAPLLERYHATSEEQTGVQAALLTAMVGVADPAFAEEFVAAAESKDVGILQAALRGLRVAGETSKLPRCRTLMSHADARVRLAAIEAVGVLGAEDADVEALLAKLNAAVEPNETARDSAWRGLRQVLAKRTVAERIRAADRLREMPDLAARYLEELAVFLAGSSNHVAELDTVRDRLATMLVTAGKDAEAVPHLRELYAMRSSRADGSAKAVGLRWLEAVLRSVSPTGLTDVVLRLKETSADDSMKTDILNTVGTYLDSPAALADPERARRLLAELRGVPPDLFGDGWTQTLQRFANQVEGRDAETGGRSSP